MGLKFGQKYQISVFFGFCSVSGRDKGFLSRHWSSMSRHTAACRDTGRRCRDILLLVATYCCLSRHRSRCRDILLLVATYFPMSRHTFLTAASFFSPICRSHNFFVLTRIWACEYSLESSLNVECSHEGI